ncbi:permease [Schizophyllum amplum]|uniref:Permease n=1 Tax=Schizophyllum amplum TaxID=97359 RepID=A0A550C916_9AGAR|nr:permease [Auriculariopsis ampla]
MRWIRPSDFKSRQAFLHAIQSEQADIVQTEDHQWSNVDLDPSPPKDRTWNSWVYFAFWLSHAANGSAWTSGSSTITLGLSPLSAWLSLAFAHLFVTALIVLNGRGPSRYHIGFPVIARSVFGVWGSYMVIFMRAVVCIVWNGVNSYYGGKLVSVAIKAIWPSWGNLPNALPASAGITSTDMAAFWIFIMVFAGMSFIHSRDLRYFYQVKSVLVFIVMHALLIWWMVKAKGVNFTVFPEAHMSTDSRAWLVLQAFNAGLGTASSLTVNQGDMARYATKPNDPLWTTLIGYPIASALPCLYGILVASASKKITGTALWNLWDTLDYMLDQYPESENRGARFGIFLLASILALAYVGTNLAINSLPFGSDMTAMFPRYFTIRRGQFAATMLGVCIVPWKILVSAKAFLTFLSGYGYWLAPIAAVLTVDYYYVKRGNIDLPHLYTGAPTGRYYYTKGWNWRAISVVILSLLPCLPGFANSVATEPLNISVTSQRLFYIGFVLTYAIACVMYYAICLVFPEPRFDEPFEALADANDAREAAGEKLIGTDTVTAVARDEDPSDTASEEKKDGADVYVLSA